ncbi:MAG TPA: rod shape-determining protein MreD [Acidobacteriota bacterium]|nr:rod shape-determining protein MreD [Acidobacteriota bacterium]
MRSVLQIVVLMLVVGTAQTTLTQMLPPLGLVDGLMVAIGLLALRRTFASSVLIGALAGFVQDSLSGGIVGLHAFSKTVVAALITSLGSVIVVRGQLAETIVIGGAAVLEGTIVMGLLGFFAWPGGEALATIAARGGATAVVGGLIIAGGPRLVVGWQRRRRRSPLSPPRR